MQTLWLVVTLKQVLPARTYNTALNVGLLHPVNCMEGVCGATAGRLHAADRVLRI